jgi:hypothetical protein
MPESLGDLIAKCERVMEQHGHGVICVFGGETPAEHGFAYTYGRQRQGKPDLLLDGSLHPDTAKAVLNDAVWEAGVTEPGEYEKVLRHHKVRVVPAGMLGAALMTLAWKFAPEEGTLQALQVLWPDPDGRFPGDPGYDAVRWPQTNYGGE